MFQRTFISDDENLTRLWRTVIDPIQEMDDSTWETKIREILTNAGYTVRD
jgi:hypothetical protein